MYHVVIPVARFRRKTAYRPCDFPNTTTCILVFVPLLMCIYYIMWICSIICNFLVHVIVLLFLFFTLILFMNALFSVVGPTVENKLTYLLTYFSKCGGHLGFRSGKCSHIFIWRNNIYLDTKNTFLRHIEAKLSTIQFIWRPSWMTPSSGKRSHGMFGDF